MHFAIQKEFLVKALKDVSSAIANRVVQPVLSNVLVETVDNVTLRFTGTDLDLTIQATSPAVVYTEGSITLPGKKLLEVVSKLPNDLVSFQVNTETFETLVTCQKSKFNLSGLAALDYPKVFVAESEAGFLMPADVLRRAISQTAFAAAGYDASSILGGVYLLIKDGVFEATATDASRLAHRHEMLTVNASSGKSAEGEAELQGESEGKTATATLDKPHELRAIVPARACSEALKIFDTKDPGARIRIAVSEGQMTLQNDSHTLSTRLLGGEYPKYHELFPSEYTHLAQFSREAVLAAIERVAVMSDERTNLIKLHFENQNLTVSSNTPDVGRAQEEVGVSFEGTVIEVAVNVRYVLDVLQKLAASEIRMEMTGSLKPLIFKAEGDESYKYLLMPVQAR